jgi:hypothetical protein
MFVSGWVEKNVTRAGRRRSPGRTRAAIAPRAALHSTKKGRHMTRFGTSAALVICALASSLSVAGCGASALDERTDLDQAEIIGGKPESGDPAVVVFDMTTGGKNLGVCTASFIAHDALLTAGHCVVDDGGSVIPADATYRVFLGPNTHVAKDKDWIPVPRASVHLHPKFDLNAEDPHDTAIIKLPRRFDVTPLPVNTEPLTNDVVGKPARIVGYGQRILGDQESKGIKRKAKTIVRDFDSTFVHVGVTGTQTCHGDSGGPALVKIHGRETIIGTVSFAFAVIRSVVPDCSR